MLDMGFIPDIERIFKLTPPKKQTLFFSATMPPEITRLTKQFLNDPTRIEASAPATTNENIAQHLVRIPSSDPKAKRLALRALVGADDVKNGIVFCNRKSEVDVVAKSLRSHGFDAAAIHGDLDQSTRTRTLDNFRKGELRLLVASDVAARGLDIPDVSHVFNYDVPHHADDYVHRIGRTGRAGKTGKTYMIITPADARNLDKVLKLIGKAPAEETLDLDFSNAVSQPGEREARSSRRPPRGDRPDRPIRPHRERAPMHPTTVIEAADRPEPAKAPQAIAAATEETARPPRRRRGPKPAAAEAAAPAQAPAPTPGPERKPEPAPLAPRGVRSAPVRDEDYEPGVRGFGADTPAFLMRAPPRRTSTDED